MLIRAGLWVFVIALVMIWIAAVYFVIWQPRLTFPYRDYEAPSSEYDQAGEQRRERPNNQSMHPIAELVVICRSGHRGAQTGGQVGAKAVGRQSHEDEVKSRQQNQRNRCKPMGVARGEKSSTSQTTQSEGGEGIQTTVATCRGVKSSQSTDKKISGRRPAFARSSSPRRH